MRQQTAPPPTPESTITISSRGTDLAGLLAIPPDAKHLVIFAHATPNCCHNVPNHYLAKKLYQAGIATLLVDLLSCEEQLTCQRSLIHYDQMTLAMRLIGVTDWLHDYPEIKNLMISYVGLSGGGSIAVLAAMERPNRIQTVILPSTQVAAIQLSLSQLQVPVLFISGEYDIHNILLGQNLFARLPKNSHVVFIDRAADLITHPSLDRVSQLIKDWLGKIE